MKQVLIAVLSLVLGLASGYLYLLTLDLMILAVLVLSMAMMLGAWRGSRPWLPALLLSLAAPAAAALTKMRGIPVFPGRIATVAAVALASSFLGAYAGSAMRRMIANIFNRNG